MASWRSGILFRSLKASLAMSFCKERERENISLQEKHNQLLCVCLTLRGLGFDGILYEFFRVIFSQLSVIDGCLLLFLLDQNETIVQILYC